MLGSSSDLRLVEEEILDALHAFARDLGRSPTTQDLRDTRDTLCRPRAPSSAPLAPSAPRDHVEGVERVGAA